jgi:hypothetical protein
MNSIVIVGLLMPHVHSGAGPNNLRDGLLHWSNHALFEQNAWFGGVLEGDLGRPLGPKREPQRSLVLLPGLKGVWKFRC